MKTYRTSEVANMFGVHPNTIRLYEKWGNIAPAKRTESGYRIYTEEHLNQIRITRILLRSDIVKSYMRFEARNIIKSVARNELDQALKLADQYLSHIYEVKKDEINIVRRIEQIFQEDAEIEKGISLNRSDVASLLGISNSKVINWERSGMLEIPRNAKNSYRIYQEKEIKYLKVVNLLRQENYSTQCIINMIGKWKDRMNTGEARDDDSSSILLSSIEETEKDVKEVITFLKELINRYMERNNTKPK